MAIEKGQKDKHTLQKNYTENHRSSSTNPTKTGRELRYSERVSNSCSTSDAEFPRSYMCLCF